MSKTYRVIDNTTVKDKPYGTAKIEISEEGAIIIWSAYEKLYGKYCQAMDTRENRGGICYTSEIENWKKQKALPNDFDFMNYAVQPLSNLEFDEIQGSACEQREPLPQTFRLTQVGSTDI